MAAIGIHWDDVWQDVWQDVWEQAGAAINDGDEVMVLIAPNGIACSVLIDSGTAVRVVNQSAIQIHVLITGGTPIRVTI